MVDMLFVVIMTILLNEIENEKSDYLIRHERFNNINEPFKEREC